MLKKTFVVAVVIAAVLLASEAACADRILSIKLMVHLNDSVNVDYIKIEDGYATKNIPAGDYRLTFTDDADRVVTEISMRPGYALMSDPPSVMGSSLINMRVPYREDMKYVALYHNDARIMLQPINPCNGNGVCEIKYESYPSCPKDCQPDKADGTCIKESDKNCDPDCEEGIDPDCTTGLQWLTVVLYALSALVVIAVLAYYFYRELENRRLDKERREFLRWRSKHP